jgi:hypothetical protein
MRYSTGLCWRAVFRRSALWGSLHSVELIEFGVNALLKSPQSMNQKLCALLLVILLGSLRVGGQSSEPDKAALRKRLAEINLTGAFNWPDYLERAVQVRDLIPDIHKAYEGMDKRLDAARKRNANNPTASKLVKAITRLNGFDKKGLAILERELDKAYWLGQLSSDEDRSAYFEKEIRPLRDEMIKIAKEEVAYTRELKAKRIVFPPDIEQAQSKIGAEEGTRTPTPLRVHGPEPCASANSATSAHLDRQRAGRNARRIRKLLQ